LEFFGEHFFDLNLSASSCLVGDGGLYCLSSGSKLSGHQGPAGFDMPNSGRQVEGKDRGADA